MGVGGFNVEVVLPSVKLLADAGLKRSECVEGEKGGPPGESTPPPRC